LNYFTAADFARKRFVAIEVVPSPPLPRQILGESVVCYLKVISSYSNGFTWLVGFVFNHLESKKLDIGHKNRLK